MPQGRRPIAAPVPPEIPPSPGPQTPEANRRFRALLAQSQGLEARLRSLPSDLQAQYQVRRRFAEPDVADEDVLDSVLQTAAVPRRSLLDFFAPEGTPVRLLGQLGRGLAGGIAETFRYARTGAREEPTEAGSLAEQIGRGFTAPINPNDPLMALTGVPGAGGAVRAVRTGYEGAAAARAALQAQRALRTLRELPLTPTEKLARRGVGPLAGAAEAELPRVGGVGAAVQGDNQTQAALARIQAIKDRLFDFEMEHIGRIADWNPRQERFLDTQHRALDAELVGLEERLRALLGRPRPERQILDEAEAWRRIHAGAPGDDFNFMDLTLKPGTASYRPSDAVDSWIKAVRVTRNPVGKVLAEHVGGIGPEPIITEAAGAPALPAPPVRGEPPPPPSAAPPTGGGAAKPPPPPPRPPGGGLPPSAAPPDFEAARSKLIELIQGAKPVREETQALYHARRQQQAAILAQTFQERGGEATLHKALGSLKGELPKARFTPPEGAMTAEEAGVLYNAIWETPKLREFERVQTGTAFRQLFAGGLPPSRTDLVLLERVFGSDFVEAVLAKRGLGQKAWEEALGILGLPRALKSSIDLSAPLRQGAMLVGQPREFGGATVDMFKVAFSEKNLVALDEGLRQSPHFELAERSGLYLAPVGRAATLAAREEAFATRLASRIPGLGFSQRTYVGFLNSLRARTFYSYAAQWGEAATPEQYGRLASFINAASGRGSLGPLEEAAPLVAQAFFSPRFLAGRIQAPLYLVGDNPFAKASVSRVAARNLTAFIGAGVGLLSLVKLSGLADVNLDPRSADFGKAKFGHTRVDFFAGYLQLARFVAMEMTGKGVSSAGKPFEANRLETAVRFGRSKAAPVAGAGLNILAGQELAGDEVRWDGNGILDQAGNLLAPMNIATVVEAVQDQRASGLLWSVPSTFGVGVNTYQTDAELRDDTARRMFGSAYLDLDYAQRQKVLQDSSYQAEIAARDAKRGTSSSGVRAQAEQQFDQLRQMSADLVADYNALGNRRQGTIDKKLVDSQAPDMAQRPLGRREFREAIKAVARDHRKDMARAHKAFEEFAAKHGIEEFTPRNLDDINRQEFLSRYNDLELIDLPTGQPDYRRRQTIKEWAEQQYGKDTVERWLGAGREPVHPLVQAWWDGLDTYRDYFAVQDFFLAHAPEALRREIAVLEQAELTVENPELLEGIRADASPEVKKWQEMIREVRRERRRDDPGLDAWLFAYGYVNSRVKER